MPTTKTYGNGNQTIIEGSDETITVGNGNDTITIGSNDTLSVGNGNDTVTAGSGSSISAGNGNDNLTAGSNSKISAGNGNDTVAVGSNSTVTLGNGNDTVSMAANDTVSVGKGNDTFIFQAAETPTVAAPATLSVNAGGAIALPISIGNGGFGHDVIAGFSASNDKIQFDTTQFANFAAVTAHATQSGSDTVIAYDASDSITLKGVSLSSLTTKNFSFVTGSPASAETITITGIPADVTLSDTAGPLTVTNGSITLTPAQLAGLTLHAGTTSATLTVTVTGGSGVTATSVSQTIALNVSQQNHPAVIGDPTVHDVTEDVSVNTSGNLTAVGTISISDPDPGQSSFQTTVTGGAGNLGSLSLQANGNYTYTVADSLVQYLGAGDSKIDSFTVTSFDGTQKQVSFTIHGTNDAAVIGSPTVADVTEDVNVNGSGNLTAVGTISISDADQNQSSFQTTVTGAVGNLGSLSLQGNGNYTYTVANTAVQYLGSGDSKVDSLTSFDGTQKQVSFTIHGTNDAAVIGDPTVADVTEDVNVDGSGNLAAVGTISISDADQNQSSFQIAVTGAVSNLGSMSLQANGNYTYTVADTAVQFLGSGDSKVDSFTVTSFDGTQKQVSFTIHGANGPASISGTASGSVTEDGTLTAGGMLTVSDVDNGESHFQSPTPTSLSGTYGTFTFDPSTGVWGYRLNNAAANVQALIGTDVRDDTLTVTSVDGTASQVIDVSVHGTYDVSYIADGTVDPSATKASTGHPNEIIDGSGIPANHFGLAEVTDAGIELGMQIIYRQGPVVTTSDDYSDGVLHFAVNSGAQSTVNGSQGNNAARAAWSFDYSIATGLNGQSTNLSNYTFELLVDVDPSAGTNYHTLQMVAVPPGTNATGYVWIDDSVSASGPLTINGHPIVIGDDAGNARVAQNSENYAFGFLQNYLTSVYGPGNNFNGPAHFDLVLEAIDSAQTVVAQNHVVVDVNAAPVAVADDGTVNPAFQMTEDDGAKTFNVRANDTLDADAGAANNITLGAISVQSNALGITARDLVASVDASNNVQVQLVGSVWQELAANQTFDITIPYTLHGNLATDVSSANLTVRVLGLNDPASISGTASGAVTEDGTLTAGGTLTVSDVDNGESHFQSPTPTSLSGTYGTFTFDPSTGVWGYTLNNATANVQALIGTDVRDDTLTVTSVDGTASQVIDVSVHGTYDVSYIADGTVDPSATKASTGHPNEIIDGSGIPANHFGLAEITDAGIELGMQIIYRQGPVVTTSDDYSDGVLHFAVNSGAQSTVNGSQGNNAARAAWSFDYSIATGLNGQTTNLSNYTFELLVDVDPSAGTNYHTLQMVAVPPGTNATGYVWVDDSLSASGPLSINGHPIVIGDDAGNAKVAQNSENYAFGFIQNYLTSAYGPGNNFNGPAHFDLVLEAIDSAQTVVAQNHVAVDVTPSAPVVSTVMGQPVNGSAIELQGTGVAGLTVDLYADGGSTVVGSGIVGANGTFDIVTTTAFGDALHTITATETDGSLASAVSAALTVNVLPNAPVLTTQVGQPVNGSTIEIQGTGEAGQTVNLYADGGSAIVGTGIVDAGGTFDITTTATFAAGTHTITATETDVAGLSSAASAAFSVNVNQIGPPTPLFNLAAADQVGTTSNPQTQSATVTLVGQTGPNDSVTLFDGQATFSTISSKTGAFQFAGVDLAQGANALTVQATDANGASSTYSLTVQRLASTGLADAAVQWNANTLRAIATAASAPTFASRALAMESLAVYDAVSAIDGTPGYLINATAPAGADANAAVAQAAHDVLANLYPAQNATFDAELATSLAPIATGAGKSAGIALGQTIAAEIIALRANDGWDANVIDDGGTGVGVWTPTAPSYAPALDPQWANVTPFALTTPNQFDPSGPPDLTSAQYAADVMKTESLGSATSTTRTASETAIANFWKDGTGTFTPPGQWNSVAESVAQAQGDSLAQDARLFAVLNVAEADAGIAAWSTKYTYNTWRPITAIQNANEIGNPGITQDASWQPLIITPPFPEYISGHSTFSAAAAEVLSSFFGSSYAFTATAPNGATRNYTSFWQAANEAGESRIYGGIHFEFSNQDGLATGTQVGDWVLNAFNLSQDTVPPKVVLDQTSGLVTNYDPTITGHATDNLSGVALLQATLDGTSVMDVAVASDGSFSVATPAGLADGVHSLSFVATDAAGNVSDPVEFDFTVATQAPQITLAATSIQDSGLLAADTHLTGTVTLETGDTLTALSYAVDGGTSMPINFDLSGDFDATLDLSELSTGPHTLALTATEAAGNTATKTLHLSEPTLPPLTISEIMPMMGSGSAGMPAMIESDVGVTSHPEIKFSRPVDPNTFNSSSFYATDSTGAVLSATVVRFADNTGGWLFFNNPLPGSSMITLHVRGDLIQGTDGSLLDAAGSGTAGSIFTGSFSTVSTAPIPATTITGQVVDPGPDLTPMTPDDVTPGSNGLGDFAHDTYKLPIAGAKVYVIGHEDQAVYTDSSGRFTLTNVPAGDVKVVVDGNTATNAPSGTYFPEMVFDENVQPGVANTLMGGMGSHDQQIANAANQAVYLPRLQKSILTPISSTGTTVVTMQPDAALGLTAEQASEISLTVPAGSLIGFDGQPITNGSVGLEMVPVSMIQDMLPTGLDVTATLTIQAPGVAKFATPLTFTFPNLYGAAPGSQVYTYSYDHTTGMAVVDGTATVSVDGKTITTDPGDGITMPGWHAPTPPKTPGNMTPPMPCQELGKAVGQAYSASFLATASQLFNINYTKASSLHYLSAPSPTPRFDPNKAAEAGRWLAYTPPNFIKEGELNDGDPIYDENGKVVDNIHYLDGYTVIKTFSYPDTFQAYVLQGPTGDIIVATRGTTGNAYDWGSNGYLATDKYLAHSSEVLSYLQQFTDAPSILFTGHSQGGASAWYLAYGLQNANNGSLSNINVATFNGLSPDLGLQSIFGSLNANYLGRMQGLDYGDPNDRVWLIGGGSPGTTLAIPDSNLIEGLSAAHLQPFDAVQLAQATRVQLPYYSVDSTTRFFAPLVGEALQQIDTALHEYNNASGDTPTDFVFRADAILQILEAVNQIKVAIDNSPSSEKQEFMRMVSDMLRGLFFDFDAGKSNLAPSNGFSQAFNIIPSGFWKALVPGSDPPLGATVYAELTDAGGNVQHFTITDPNSGITICLSPNSDYTLTEFDPTTGLIGSVCFHSGNAGTPTDIPEVMLIPDADAPGVDGLTPLEAAVIGVNPNIPDNLVPGITDLAALQEGLYTSPTLPGTTGIVANLAMQGTAEEVTLAASAVNNQQIFAYITTAGYGLAIADVSNYLKPVLDSQLALAGNATDVAIDPILNLAAVADGSGGLRIVNVVDPSSPALVQTIPITATHVVVTDGTVYANDDGQFGFQDARLDSFDLATGQMLQSLDLGSTAHISGIARDGTKLYTMDTNHTLHVIDVSSGDMVLDGSVVLPAGGNGIFVADGVAYVSAASGNFGLGGYITVDVSNPFAPALIHGSDQTNLGGAAMALNGSGTGVMVGSVASRNAVDLVNTSDPTQTGQFITEYILPQQPYNVAIGSGIAYVADGTAGLQVVNYKYFDTAGIAPTVSITQLPASVNPNAPGLVLDEGQFITLGITASDDVQVRNVELLINGQVVQNAVSYPWNIETTLPSIAANGSNQLTLQVEAIDTGGNIGLSSPVTVTLVHDTVPPQIVSENLSENAIRGQSFRAITYKFSKPLDPATVNSSTFRLIGPGGVAVAPVSIELSDRGTNVEIAYSTLAVGQYQAQVDATVADTAGVALGTNVDTDFTIQQFTNVWTNASGGSWSTGSNWSTGSSPSATDDAYVGVTNLGLPVPMTITASNTGITMARMLANSGVSLQLSGGSLTLNSESEADGSVTENGGTLTFNGNATVNALTLTGQNNGFGGGGGYLAGSGTVTVTGSLNWGGFSAMFGTGKTVLAAGSTATIANGLSRELDIGGQATIAANTSINLGSNGGPGTLSVLSSGVLTLQSGSGENDTAVNNSGSGNSVQNAGTLVMTGTGTRTIAVPLINSGTVDVQSGILNLTGGVSNSGTLQAEAGATLQINGGSIGWASGSRLAIAGNLTINNATLVTNPGDQISVAGALNVHLDAFGSSTLTLNSAVTPASVTIDGATLNANASLTTSSLTLGGHGTSFGFAVLGTLAGSSAVTVTNSMSWTGGSMSGTGTTVIAAGASANVTANVNLSRELDIAGQATLGTSGSGNAFINMGSSTASGAVKILSGGTLAIWGAVPGFSGQGINNSGGGYVENAGRLIGEGAESTANINVGVTNDATGTIDVQSGILSLNGGGSSTGILQDEAGATLQIGGGTFALASGSQLNAAGNLTVNNATLTTDPADQMFVSGALTVHLDAFGSSTLNLNNALTPASVTVDGGTLNANAGLTATNLNLVGHGTSFGFGVSPTLAGNGAVNVTGSMSWSSGQMSGTGTTVVAAGATANLTGNMSLTRELDIVGHATLGVSGAGNSFINMGSSTASGVVKILSGGSLAIWGAVPGFSGQGINNSGGGFVENAGTLIGQGVGSTANINVGVTNDATGTIDVQSGTLSLNGGGSSTGILQDEAGATLQFGGGTFTLAAGSQLNAAGNLSINNATLTTDAADQMSVAGALTVRLDAFGSSTLNLNNALSPASVTIDGGTLNANAAVTASSMTLTSHGTSFGFTVVGVLGGSADVTVTSSLTMTSFGNLSGSGRLILASTATAAIGGNERLSREMDIAGQATLSANASINLGANGGPGTLSITSSGKLTLQSEAGENDTAITNNSGGNSMQNAGTLIGAGGGARTIGIGLANTGTIDVQSGVLSLNGGVTNSGMLEADGGNLFVAGNSVAGNGLITGGSILQFGGASVSTNVQFGGGSTGTLRLDQSQSYTGTLTGFSLTSNTTKLDLSDIAFASGTTTATFAGNSSGGVLTVKDASNHTAHIVLQGADYTGATWVTASDTHGGTLVQDPSFISAGEDGGNATISAGAQLEMGPSTSESILFAGNTGTLTLDQSQSFTPQISGFGGADQIDLADIAFDANTTTLGYSGNSGNSSGTLSVSDGTHSANLALLGSYMASSFATSSDGHGGTLITNSAQPSSQPPLTPPH